MIRFDHVPDGEAISMPQGAYNPAVMHVIARVDAAGKLLGGVTYDNYHGTSICMHVRSFAPGWLTKDLLWVIFHYPFVNCNCLKVLAFVPSCNQKALDFDAKIGFKEEHRIVDACDGGDLVVMSMRREDCRWLNIKPVGLRVTPK